MLQTPVNGVPISLTMNCKGYFPFNEMSCVVPILTTWIFSNLNRMDSRPKIRRRTFFFFYKRLVTRTYNDKTTTDEK